MKIERCWERNTGKSITLERIERNRIESLDHLRGLMALSVMTYHYVSWGSGQPGSGSVLGKLGVYAVAIFYVLSGLSLSLVYADKLTGGADIIGFWWKRVFRIFPLYYLVVTVSLALSFFSSVIHGDHYSFPWRAAVLNYSLLFGFISPSTYLSTGAWSIGNEMVFYSIFPLLLYFSRWAASLVWLALAFSVAAGMYFAFYVLSPGTPIETQWNSYINPFNQLFLFLSGVAIGMYLRPSTMQAKRLLFAAVGLLCVMVFVFVPAYGDEIVIASGVRRVVLAGAAVIFVSCVFVASFSFKGMAGKFLGFLGEGCYSIYLLHPLVAVPFAFIFSRYHARIGYAYVIAFAATLLLSRITYRYLEHPMIVLGRRVSKGVVSSSVIGA